MQDSTVEGVAANLAAGVTDELRALALWLVQHRQADLRALEDGLLERGHALLLRLLGAALATAPAADVGRACPCAGCGARMHRLGRRGKWRHTSLGHLHLERTCSDCGACQRTAAPLDRQLGIDASGRSPRLVEVLTLLGAEVPFAAAADRLRQLCLGVEVSPSQLQQVTEAVGRCLEAEHLEAMEGAWSRYELPPVERRMPWLVVALDGVMVPEQSGYHEVRTAAVAGAGPPAAARDRPNFAPWCYVVHAGDTETFGKLVWCEAWRQGLPDAERVLVLGDGAEWIWKLAGWHFPQAVPILDLWHATEHLWTAGRALYGDTDARVAAWVEQARQPLLAGKVQLLLNEWAALAPKDPQAWEQELTYFGNQAARMRYDEYRAAGYPIGSGAVESANRHVVGVRVKQAGMRWTRRGVRGVLALRALLRSGRWDLWWRQHPLPIPLAA